MTVITISRQYASGGDEVARKLCDSLGCRYFDKRLIAQVALEAGLSTEEVVDYSEEQHEIQSFLGRLLGRPRAVGELRVWKETPEGVRTMEIERLDQDRAAGLVQLAINSAYTAGNVVIVGRGGQAILRDKPDVLHVRLEAPFDLRVQRIQKAEGLTQGFAYETVMKRDASAADYIRRFYNVDWADPTLYHMVLNLGKLSIPAAVDLITSAVRHISPA